jgi:hypothetical protein
MSAWSLPAAARMADLWECSDEKIASQCREPASRAYNGTATISKIKFRLGSNGMNGGYYID